MEKKLIEVTPEWILENISYRSTVEENVFIIAYHDVEFELIRMALNKLKISYVERTGNDTDDYIQGFEFRLEDIQTSCPSFYKYLTTPYRP